MKRRSMVNMAIISALMLTPYIYMRTYVRRGRQRDETPKETQQKITFRAMLKRERKAAKRLEDYVCSVKDNPCLKNTGKNWMTAK